MSSLANIRMNGGRSSVSGIRATVFGATGFLGSYVVNRLGKVGSQVICPFRGDELHVRKLKVMGDLGNINPYPMSIRNAEQIERAVAGSNVVINLLGISKETSRFSFNDIHATFPGVLAEVCAEQGVEKFIHVSSLGASVDSPSLWQRSKAVGEQLVKEAMPSAVIVRPASIFGDEDRFLNHIAKIGQTLPFVPLIDAETTRQQPVFVDDVAAAIVDEGVANPATQGHTLELAGPKVYTNQEIANYVLKTIGEAPVSFNVPAQVGMGVAYAAQLIPDPWLTCDSLRKQSVDIVRTAGGTGFEGTAITPTAIEDVAERYLVRFRKSSVLVDNGKVIKQPN